MSVESMKCPKCDGTMEQGFVLDYGYGRIQVEAWVRGKPRRSFWAVIKGANKKNEQTPIGVFRCESCGYLEHYARPEFKVE